MSIMNARRGAYMQATGGGTDRKKSSNYGGRKSNSTKTQKSGSRTQKKSTKSSTGYDNRSNAASGNANKNSNKKTTQKTGLEALIDRKDELKNIPANDGSGRNQYQVEMNRFKSTPGGKKIFKKRFPNPLLKIAQGLGNYVRQGGALGILANALGGGKGAATSFGKDAATMATDIGGALGKVFGLDALQNKNIDIASGGTDAEFNKLIKGQQAYDPSGLEGYRDKIMDMVPPKYGEDYIYDKSYMLPGAMEEAVLAGSEPYSNFKEQISSDTSADQQEVARDDERLDNLLVDLGIVGDQPLSSVTEEVSETDYDTSGLRRQIMNNPGTTTFGAVPGQNFNVFDPLAYLQENPITEDMIETDIIGQANGGYMSSFPNQNLNTKSLSASDNIDDRIMKNLEFEKMAPGMMGYNEGGKVMSTYDKLKAIADNNYG